MARFVDVDKIDTEKAYKRNEIYYRDSFKSGVVSTLHLLAKMTTADVVEVKHGKWEEWWDDNYLSYCHKCSECGSYPLTKEETMHDEVLSNFCPNCGAKMDGTPKERSAANAL